MLQRSTVPLSNGDSGLLGEAIELTIGGLGVQSYAGEPCIGPKLKVYGEAKVGRSRAVVNLPEGCFET
jgi:hypothetical protein